MASIINPSALEEDRYRLGGGDGAMVRDNTVKYRRTPGATSDVRETTDQGSDVGMEARPTNYYFITCFTLHARVLIFVRLGKLVHSSCEYLVEFKLVLVRFGKR